MGIVFWDIVIYTVAKDDKICLKSKLPILEGGCSKIGEYILIENQRSCCSALIFFEQDSENQKQKRDFWAKITISLENIGPWATIPQLE